MCISLKLNYCVLAKQWESLVHFDHMLPHVMLAYD